MSNAAARIVATVPMHYFSTHVPMAAQRMRAA